MLLNPEQSRVLLAFALEERFAILAVNADSPAAVTDSLEAARRCQAPIIIEASLWQLEGRSFGSGDAVCGMARYIADLSVMAGTDLYRDIPVIFHTDHIKGPRTWEILSQGIRGIPVRLGGKTVRLSPSTVSLDSSELSGGENIETICRLAAAAEEAGRSVTLEMEAGVDDEITSPETTRRLIGSVEARYPGRVQLYAPGLGTRHGFHDPGYEEFRPETVGRNRELLEEITGRRIGIALHGSTGLAEEALREAAAAGVVKVNWSSESLYIRVRAAADYFARFGDRLARNHAQFKQTAMDTALQSHIAKAYIPRVMQRIETLGGRGRVEACATALERAPGGLMATA